MKLCIRPVAIASAMLLLCASRSEADSSPAPAASPDLSTIINRYTAAIGGRDALAKINAQVSVYTFTLMGHPVTVTTTSKAPSYYLQVVQTEGGGGALSTGFDGKLAWIRGVDGVVHLLSGQKRAELISEAVGSNNSEIFPDRWPTAVALRPAEQVDGKSYYVLGVTPKDGIEHDILIDAQTFRPAMDRTVEPDVTSTSTVNEFETGPLGELNARVVTTTRSDGFPTIVSHLQNIRDNPAITNSIFSPPLSKGQEVI